MSFFQLAMPGIFQIFLKLFFVVFFSYKFYKWVYGYSHKKSKCVPCIFTQIKYYKLVPWLFTQTNKSFINWYLGYSHKTKKKVL